jgi:hypothetical protein
MSFSAACEAVAFRFHSFQFVHLAVGKDILDSSDPF